jgi:phosphatidyl-myo-inositol alpha-mannosyltransferase
MKVGFVLDDGLDRIDGVQQYILTLGGWLRSKGHEVVYLVGETRRADIEGVYSMSKNVKVRFNGNSLSIPLPTSRQKIKKVLKDERFDVLHIQVPYSPFMGAKTIKLSDNATSIVGTFHIYPYGWMSRLGSVLLGMALWRTVRKFDRMVSVSQPAADFARRYYKIKVDKIVPNLVDTSAFRPAKPQQNPAARRVLFLGRLVERKGCRQLLEALSILSRTNKLPNGFMLDICGDGPMRQELEDYVINNQLNDRVIFRGYVTEEQKITLMQKADISVFPSLGGESFGIVLIEAMSAGGGIVLAGDNPGYASVIGGAEGSIFEASNPKALAESLEKVMLDEEFRTELYRKQQKLVHEFDVEVVGQKMLEIYKACQKSRTNR